MQCVTKLSLSSMLPPTVGLIIDSEVDITHAIDIFSFGCILWEAFSRKCSRAHAMDCHKREDACLDE